MSHGTDQDVIRQKLSARRDELDELSEHTSEDRAVVQLDQQSVGRVSRMDAIQQQAMAQAQERSRIIEIARLDAALKRIDEGEYGWCVTCGEAIAPARLEADPAAAACVACASGKS